MYASHHCFLTSNCCPLSAAYAHQCQLRLDVPVQALFSLTRVLCQFSNLVLERGIWNKVVTHWKILLNSIVPIQQDGFFCHFFVGCGIILEASYFIQGRLRIIDIVENEALCVEYVKKFCFIVFRNCWTWFLKILVKQAHPRILTFRSIVNPVSIVFRNCWMWFLKILAKQVHPRIYLRNTTSYKCIHNLFCDVSFQILIFHHQAKTIVVKQVFVHSPPHRWPLLETNIRPPDIC